MTFHRRCDRIERGGIKELELEMGVSVIIEGGNKLSGHSARPPESRLPPVNLRHDNALLGKRFFLQHRCHMKPLSTRKCCLIQWVFECTASSMQSLLVSVAPCPIAKNDA